MPINAPGAMSASRSGPPSTPEVIEAMRSLPADTVVDGRLRLDNVDGMEAPGNEELTAETETKENLFALNPIPWKVDGKFEDARLKALARKKTKAQNRVTKSRPFKTTSCKC